MLPQVVPCESEATGEGRVLAIPGRASAFAASLAGGSLVNSGSPALTAAAATKREPSPIRCDPSPRSEQIGQFLISRSELAGEFDGVR